MKDLIKTMLALFLIFASTFIMLNVTGILTTDAIQQILHDMRASSPIIITVVIAGLLFADLFIAVPTLTIAIVAGYLLGWMPGFFAVALGFYSAGIAGYTISRYYGRRLIRYIYRDENRLNEMHESFCRLGPLFLILCRAIPILPEVSSCMAGATKMPFVRYLLLYSIGSVPYAMLATYAGSISSLENPAPAIVAAISLSVFLWLTWYIVITKNERRKKSLLGN